MRAEEERRPGRRIRVAERGEDELALQADELPEPSEKVGLDRPYHVYIPGVGGTGVITINALLALWLYPGLTADRAKTFFKFVSHMGKWSMLDVFVVAILVLTVKSGGVASVRVEGGFFSFFASVMLTQFASLWTGRMAARLEK